MSIQKHCTEDGAVITYRVRRGRDPWVLLHGLGCDMSMWDRAAAGLTFLRQEGWPGMAESLMPLLLNPAEHDFRRHRDHLMTMFERAGDASLAAALYALANRRDRRSVLPRIRVPVVVVVVDRDRLAPPSIAKEMADGVGDGRLVILPGVAHMSAMEAPREVAEQLDR